jgi:hypothetical protein
MGDFSAKTRKVILAVHQIRVGAVLVLALASCAAFGWNATGHMVMAEIAYRNMRPDVKAETSRLLHAKFASRNFEFMDAGPWADDIRSGRKETGAWHYINFHFRKDGGPVSNLPQEVNIVSVIDHQARILANRSQPDSARAEALLFLIHLVADIHQPLHTSARDSATFPGGDRGGNEFSVGVPGTSKQTNLHALWDSGAGLFKSLDRPFSKSDRHSIELQATELARALPKPRSSVLRTTPREWAKEGLALARRYVYATPEGAVPSAQYVHMSQQICGRRAALAGYRLADLLNRLL